MSEKKYVNRVLSDYYVKPDKSDSKYKSIFDQFNEEKYNKDCETARSNAMKAIKADKNETYKVYNAANNKYKTISSNVKKYIKYRDILSSNIEKMKGFEKSLDSANKEKLSGVENIIKKYFSGKPIKDCITNIAYANQAIANAQLGIQTEIKGMEEAYENLKEIVKQLEKILKQLDKIKDSADKAEEHLWGLYKQAQNL